MKPSNWIIGLLLSVGLFSAAAAQWDSATDEAKAFADEMNKEKVNNAAREIEPETVPGYEGEDVPERDLYDSGVGIEDKAASGAESNETATYVEGAAKSRPDYSISRESDPLFKRDKERTEKATGLSGTYSGCIDIPVGNEDITKYERKTCGVTGSQDTIHYDCTKSLSVECSNENAGEVDNFNLSDFEVSGDAGMEFGGSGRHWRYGSTTNNRNGNCKFFRNEVRFYVEDVDLVKQLMLSAIRYDDWLDVRLNGELMFRGIGPNQGVHISSDRRFPCEYDGINAAKDVDLLPAVKDGWNTIELVNQVHGRGNAYIQVRSTLQNGCEEEENYSYHCEGGYSRFSGDLVGSECSEVGGSKTVDGVLVTRACWKWSERYRTLSEPYFVEEERCSELESEGCGRVSSRCTDDNGTFCEEKEIEFSCPYTTAARTVSMCGDQLICSDGTCTDDYGQTYETSEDDFLASATALALAEEISSQMNHDELSVFSGDSKKCKDQSLGFANCCQSGGWGTDLGLTHCDTEEKELGIAREAERTVYVGKYKRGSFIDERTYHVYCTYPSKLARIFIEQGKSSIGNDYGSPKDPDCSGFTTDELKTLDFDAMDLSEYYEDVQREAGHADRPGSGALTNDLKDTLMERYEGIE